MPSQEGQIPTGLKSAGVKMTDAKITGDPARTRVAFEVSGAIKPAVFMLADPARIIIDIPDLQFKFNPASLAPAKGLVTAWRYGLFATRKSRIVLLSSLTRRVASSTKPCICGRPSSTNSFSPRRFSRIKAAA